MLVLSRAPDQSIVFPNCGITIHILSIRGERIKIGIEAPLDITVFRAELTPLATNENSLGITQRPIALKMNEVKQPNELPVEVVHRLRNQLNTVSLGLQLCQGLLNCGCREEALETLRQVADDLSEMDRQWIKVDSSQIDLEPDKSFMAQRPLSKPVQLLIVEDNDNERELLSGILSMKGCHCRQACDGDEAITMLQGEERFDFTLLDMHMPRMNGLETLRAIRRDERLRDMKVFSVSSTSPSEAGMTIEERGFDGWLPKPLNPVTLLNHIQACQRLVPEEPKP